MTNNMIRGFFAAAFAISAVVFAPQVSARSYAEIQYSPRQGVNGSEDSEAYMLTIGHFYTTFLRFDVSARDRDSESGDADDLRTEFGVTGFAPPTGNFTPYLRVAAGARFVDDSEVGYFSVQPGVSYSLTGSVDLDLAYRFRDAINQGEECQETDTLRLGASYRVTDRFYASTGFDFVRQDDDYNALNLSLGYRF